VPQSIVPGTLHWSNGQKVPLKFKECTVVSTPMCHDGVLAKGTLQWLSPEPGKLVWNSMRFMSSYHLYNDVNAGSVLVWVVYDLYVWATHALYTHGQYCWLLIKVDSKKVLPASPRAHVDCQGWFVLTIPLGTIVGGHEDWMASWVVCMVDTTYQAFIIKFCCTVFFFALSIFWSSIICQHLSKL